MFSSENIVFFIIIIFIVSFFVWSFKQSPRQIQSQLLASSGPFFRADVIEPVLKDENIPETAALEEATRNLINCNNATNRINTEITNLSKNITTLATKRKELFRTCNNNINTLWINYNKALKFINQPDVTLSDFKKKFGYHY